MKNRIKIIKIQLSQMFNTDIHKFVQYGNYNRVKKYISFNLPLEILSNENTLLYIASMYNRFNIVNLLVESNAVIDSINTLNQTPLTIASWNGHYEIVEYLLNKKANVNHSDKYKQTALSGSAIYGHNNIVELLLNNNADINLIDCDKINALELSVYHGNNDVSETLIKYGAINNKTSTLKHAIRHGHEEIVKQLLNNNININNGDDIPIVDASDIGNLEIVKILLNYNANPNKMNKRGINALHAALIECNHKQSSDIIKLLVPLTNINLPCNSITHIMLAAFQAKIEYVTLLIDHKANLNLCDRNGNNALHYLVRDCVKNSLYEKYMIAKVLLENNCIDRKNNNNKFAYDLAIQNEYYEIADLIQSYNLP